MSKGLNAAQEAVAWINEDELPETYPYAAMFPYSKVDGVRMFPVFAPVAAAPVELTVSDEDRAVLQRLQDALPTVGINGWAKGVEVLDRILRMTLAGTPAAPGIDLRNAILQLREDALHMKDPSDTVNAYNRVLVLIDSSQK